MKSLKDFIIESKQKREEVRIEVKDIEGSEDFLKKLKSALNEKNIYNEDIDNGLKFALQGDDADKYSSIVDILKGWEAGQEKLSSAISKTEDWISKSKEDDTKEEDNKSDDNKKEEE